MEVTFELSPHHRVTAEVRKAYRLYEERAGSLYPVQHKTGTAVTIGTWLEADEKLVRDGSGHRWYKSGFHTVPSADAARAYIRNFRSKERRDRMRVCEVEIAGNIRSKEHSPAPITLSRYLRIVHVLGEE